MEQTEEQSVRAASLQWLELVAEDMAAVQASWAGWQESLRPRETNFTRTHKEIQHERFTHEWAAQLTKKTQLTEQSGDVRSEDRGSYTGIYELIADRWVRWPCAKNQGSRVHDESQTQYWRWEGREEGQTGNWLAYAFISGISSHITIICCLDPRLRSFAAWDRNTELQLQKFRNI